MSSLPSPGPEPQTWCKRRLPPQPPTTTPKSARTTMDVTGIVEEVQVYTDPTPIRADYNVTTNQVYIKVTLVQRDGTRAYIRTQIGTRSEGWGAPIQKFNATPLEASAKSRGMSWTIEDSISRADMPWQNPLSSIWRDDEITVRGTVTPKVSRIGTEYLSVNRAVILAWRRPEWGMATLIPQGNPRAKAS